MNARTQILSDREWLAQQFDALPVEYTPGMTADKPPTLPDAFTEPTAAGFSAVRHRMHELKEENTELLSFSDNDTSADPRTVRKAALVLGWVQAIDALANFGGDAEILGAAEFLETKLAGHLSDLQTELQRRRDGH